MRGGRGSSPGIISAMMANNARTMATHGICGIRLQRHSPVYHHRRTARVPPKAAAHKGHSHSRSLEPHCPAPVEQNDRVLPGIRGMREAWPVESEAPPSDSSLRRCEREGRSSGHVPRSGDGQSESLSADPSLRSVAIARRSPSARQSVSQSVQVRPRQVQCAECPPLAVKHDRYQLWSNRRHAPSLLQWIPLPR